MEHRRFCAKKKAKMPFEPFKGFLGNLVAEQWKWEGPAVSIVKGVGKDTSIIADRWILGSSAKKL